jgi:hypothetical protein
VCPVGGQHTPTSLVRWGCPSPHGMALRCCHHKVSARIQIAGDTTVIQRWRGQHLRVSDRQSHSHTKARPHGRRPRAVVRSCITRGLGAPNPPEGSAVIPETALSASSPSRQSSSSRSCSPPTGFPRPPPPISAPLQVPDPIKSNPGEAPKPLPSS